MRRGGVGKGKGRDRKWARPGGSGWWWHSVVYSSDTDYNLSAREGTESSLCNFVTIHFGKSVPTLTELFKYNGRMKSNQDKTTPLRQLDNNFIHLRVDDLNQN